MNKKGFTLIELIVSITLVSIILVSLLSTLVKLKQTYEVIEEDSDIRIYSASISRYINNDIIYNKGISNGTCSVDKSKCTFKLKNGEERTLEIYTVDKGTVDVTDESGKKIGKRKKELSTISYIDSKTNKIKFIRTIELENRMDIADTSKITTYGYKFIALSLNEYSYTNKKDSTKKDILDVVTIHTSNDNYSIRLYATDTVDK